MLLIVNLHDEMTPLEVEALKHRILAEAGVISVQWQETDQQSVQRTATPSESFGKKYGVKPTAYQTDGLQKHRR